METAWQRSVRLERIVDALGSTPLLGALIAALTWPIATQAPSVGPDPSWVAGLYMAIGKGLQFGTQLVFTYGPLGFLEQPTLYDSGLWIVAFAYRALVYLALATALLWAARRAMPLPVAGALVYSLLVVGYLEASSVLLAFVICAASLSDRPPPGSRYLVAIGGGVLGAIELLGKLNFGITILALCLVTLLGTGRRRLYLPLFAATFLFGSLGAWLAAGQDLANLAHFGSSALQVLSGYSQAMGADISSAGWQRPFAVGAIALLLAAAAVATRRDPPAPRLAMLALAAIFGFAMFKQSFVRQGLGNASDFFPLMLGAALALAWRLPTRLGRTPAHAPAVVLLVPLIAVSIAALPTPSLWRSLEPGDHVEFLREGLRALVSPTERHQITEEGRSSMISTYRIDRQTLDDLSGRKVAVEPWEIGAAWAYGLDWQPLPVIQGYQAYTPDLDSLNAEALSNPSRPTAILRQNTRAFTGTIDASIDGRYLAWDPPAASRALLCHYRAVRTTLRWQVLYPTPGRCGAARLLERVQVGTGAPVRVPPPPPGEIVFARIRGLGIEGLERVRTALYRARDRWAIVDGGRSWRLVPDTAEDGLILRAAGGVDFPGPFALAPQARTVSFRVSGTSRKVEVSFYGQAVRHAIARTALRQPGSPGWSTTKP